ncbi:Proteasome subunit alpha type-4 [Gurleya vavrai]
MIRGRTKSNVFEEDGRILQVEYAIKNTTKAPTTIVLKCSDGIILLGFSPEKEKIYEIQSNIYVSISGFFSDALQLLSYARVNAEEFRENYDQEISVKALAGIVGELKQSFTIQGNKRPFGVCFLYAGMDGDDYCLLSNDPSGTINNWRGVCVGENEDAINIALRNEIGEKEISLDEGTREILKILGKIKECGEKKIPSLEIMHFTKEKKHFLTEDEIKQYLL